MAGAKRSDWIGAPAAAARLGVSTRNGDPDPTMLGPGGVGGSPIMVPVDTVVGVDRVERLRLVREAARVLEDMRWEEAELVLASFDLPLDRESYQSSFEFFLRSAHQATDANLIDLHRHLFPDEDASVRPSGEPSAPPGRWARNAFRLFLSHVTADKVAMTELKNHLRYWAVSAFVAHEDIEPTKEWIEEIEVGLSTCDALAAYLTPTFPDSRWCDQEVGFCVGRRVLLVPIRAGLDPYGLIGRYQAIQGGGASARELADRVIEVLAAHPLTMARMAPSLVHRLENSGSYDGTRQVMALIDRVSSWTPDLLRRMEAAAAHNDQVSEAVLRGTGQRVPERLREIVRQYGR